MDFLEHVFAASEATWCATTPEAVDLESLQHSVIDTAMIQALLTHRGIDSEIRHFDRCDQLVFIYRDTRFFIDHYKHDTVRNYVEIIAAWSAKDVWTDLELILRANRINVHERLVRASFVPSERVFALNIAIALDSLSALDHRLDTYLNAILSSAERKYS